MRKLIFGLGIAVAGLTMPSAFADYCPQQYNPCCEMDFEGFYLGGNVGVGSLIAHRNDLDGFLIDNSGWTIIDTNVTAGVQIGYDLECGHKLFGIVADWNWINTERKIRNSSNDSEVPILDDSINNEFNWFTTIRGRAGVTLCDTLMYLTAGAAVAKFETRWRSAPDEFRHNHTRWGWTAGVGVEYLAWCNFSLGAEILFLHFSENEKTFDAGGARFRVGQSDSAWIGRLVLNYRFGDLCSCLW